MQTSPLTQPSDFLSEVITIYVRVLDGLGVERTPYVIWQKTVTYLLTEVVTMYVRVLSGLAGMHCGMEMTPLHDMASTRQYQNEE